MPPTDIAELRRLHEAATKGENWQEAAMFTEACKLTLPALLDELEALREEMDALRQERDAAVYVIQINGHATDNASKLLDARDRRMKLIGAAEELERAAATEWEAASYGGNPILIVGRLQQRAAQLRQEAEDATR